MTCVVAAAVYYDMCYGMLGHWFFLFVFTVRRLLNYVSEVLRHLHTFSNIGRDFCGYT